MTKIAQKLARTIDTAKNTFDFQAANILFAQLLVEACRIHRWEDGSAMSNGCSVYFESEHAHSVHALLGWGDESVTHEEYRPLRTTAPGAHYDLCTIYVRDDASNSVVTACIPVPLLSEAGLGLARKAWAGTMGRKEHNRVLPNLNQWEIQTRAVEVARVINEWVEADSKRYLAEFADEHDTFCALQARKVEGFEPLAVVSPAAAGWEVVPHWDEDEARKSVRGSALVVDNETARLLRELPESEEIRFETVDGNIAHWDGEKLAISLVAVETDE